MSSNSGGDGGSLQILYLSCSKRKIFSTGCEEFCTTRLAPRQDHRRNGRPSDGVEPGWAQRRDQTTASAAPRLDGTSSLSFSSTRRIGCERSANSFARARRPSPSHTAARASFDLVAMRLRRVYSSAVRTAWPTMPPDVGAGRVARDLGGRRRSSPVAGARLGCAPELQVVVIEAW